MRASTAHLSIFIFFAVFFASAIELFAAPSVAVSWKGASHTAISVQAGPVVDDLLDQCGKTGLEVRYRYEFQLCSPRLYWTDRCGEERSQVQSYQHDPIAEGFFVETDLLGDKPGPDRWLVNSREEALSAVSRVEKIDIAFLGKGHRVKKGEYLSLRLTVDCRGERSGFISDLTRVLSFGFADDVLIDTGWLSFPLDG